MSVPVDGEKNRIESSTFESTKNDCMNDFFKTFLSFTLRNKYDVYFSGDISLEYRPFRQIMSERQAPGAWIYARC